MHDNENTKKVSHRGVSTRAVEIAVAAGLLLLGLLVILDNYRVGASWAEDGPEAGYFPFYVGCILACSCIWILWRTLFASHGRATVFVSHARLRLVLSVFIPSAFYVIAIYFIGIYLASAIFIGAFMYVHGRFSWSRIIPISLFVPVSMFMMFEVWFLVPLPKGPFETLIGY